VIAQASPGRYAFHRGSVELGPPPPAPNQPGKPGNKSQQMQEGKPADLLENLRVKNSAVIEQQRGNLKQIYQQDKQGVAPEAAF
jgi:hypothetical protein